MQSVLRLQIFSCAASFTRTSGEPNPRGLELLQVQFLHLLAKPSGGQPLPIGVTKHLQWNVLHIVPFGGDTKPFAILVVTSRHLYLADVLFLDKSNAATCGPEVQNFVIDSLPFLREHVVAVSTDNHLGMAQVFTEHLKPLLPHAHHQRCVGHVVNLVGGDLLGAEILVEL